MRRTIATVMTLGFALGAADRIALAADKSQAPQGEAKPDDSKAKKKEEKEKAAKKGKKAEEKERQPPTAAPPEPAPGYGSDTGGDK